MFDKVKSLSLRSKAASKIDDSQNSSLFEVTRDGRVVWEAYTEQEDGFMIELYNADKFVPPLEFLNE